VRGVGKFELKYDGVVFTAQASQYNEKWISFHIHRPGTLSNESFLMLQDDAARLLTWLHSFINHPKIAG
jgi:hypothetical protein